MSTFTPTGLIASSSLFKAKASPSNPTKPGYYLHLLTTAADWETDGKRLKSAVDEMCRQVGGPNVFDLIKRGLFRYPIRRVDPEKAQQKGWPSNIAFDVNLKSGEDFRPKIVDEDLEPVLDSDEVYPGRFAKASVSLYPYPAGKSPIPGVGIGLNNVQLRGHGPRFAGSRGDGSEFGGPGGLASPDDLSDLV
jgi:Enterobacter phage Enc34, ssDNA-binding protein